MEEAKDTVAPLVAMVAGIIDYRLLLMDEYPEEDNAPIDLHRLRDLHRNLVVKLVAVILGVCSPLNKCDI